MDANKKERIFIIMVGVVIIFRIMLQVQMPLFIWADAAEDDQLMVKYALSIESGHWLGMYDGGTLKKLPGYALFLVLRDMLNIPYSFALGVVYVLASVCFLCALCKYVKSFLLRYIFFCIVLFSPIMFSNVAIHVYNLSIGPALSIIIISSYFALFMEYKNGWKRYLPWLLLAAITTAYAYIVRQDNINLVLFALGAGIVNLVRIILYDKEIGKKYRVMRAMTTFIPIVAVWLSVQIVCFLNYSHYGLYVTSDFTDSAFANVCADLMKIDSESSDDSVYVSQESMKKAFNSSPTLALLEEEFNNQLEHRIGVNENGEMDREYYAWTLRWAAQNYGIYNGNAVETDAFFKQIHEELQEAFEQGELKKRNVFVVSTMSPPITMNKIGDILAYSVKKGLWNVISYTVYQEIPLIYENEGSDANMKMFEEVLDQDEFSLSQIQDAQNRHFSGWLLGKYGEEIAIYVNDGGNSVKLEFQESADVQADVGNDYVNAEKCRFSYSSQNIDAQLKIYVDSQLYYDGLISEFEINDDGLLIGNIDENEIKMPEGSEQGELTHPNSVERLTYIRIISKVYKMTAIPLFIVVFISFVLSWIKTVIKAKKKEVEDSLYLLILQLGIFLSMWVNQVIVAMNFFAVNKIGTPMFYTGTSYVLWNIFCVAGLISIIQMWKNKKVNK